MARYWRFRFRVSLVGILAVLAASSLGFAQSSTSTTLSVTPSSAETRQVVTLTATPTCDSCGGSLKAGIPVTVGTVTFSDGQQVLGTAQIVKTSGMAILRVRFAAGLHSLSAHFNGTSSLQASQSTPQPYTVTGTEPTLTTLTAQPDGSNYDFTASVFGFGFLAETGTATFTDLTTMTTLGSVALVGPGISTFQPQQTYPVGLHPQGVAVADFNGDGIADLAVGDQVNFQSTLSVLLGNGDGTFQPQLTYQAGSFVPIHIAVADLNGDGFADVVFTDLGNLVYVLLGNGDGTFQPQQTFPVDGFGANGVAVADFNRDGNADVAVSNGASNTVSVLLGNGDGTLQPQQTYPVGIEPTGLAVADFNGDGFADLAITNNSDNTVSVLLGKGDGTFQPQQTYPVGVAPNGVTVADFNGDGFADLAEVGSFTNSLSILLGKGDGTFLPQQTYVAPISEAVVAADFNGDGIPDLAVGAGVTNLVFVLLGKGDGTFQAAQTFSVGNGPFFVGTGDFNGDGVPDLAAPNVRDATVSVLLGGTVTTAQLTNIPIFGSGNHDVQSAYAPDTDFYTGSLSNIVQVAAHQPDTTSTAVSSTPNPSDYLQTVTITATVTGDHGGSPTGTVTFTADGNTICANVSLTQMQGGSIATCQIATLTPGTHSLLASYSGDPNFGASSGVGSQVVNAATVLAVLTPNSVAFGNQTVGTTSPPQVVVLSNPGSATLNINGIALSGANSSSFNLMNGCGSTLAAGNSCNLSVTFSPGTTGSFGAAITVTDNAANSPQGATLTGTGIAVLQPDFVVTSPTPAQTVNAGGTAQFSISLTSINGAFNNSVTLSASGLPTGATATFAPATATPGSDGATSTLSVQTAPVMSRLDNNSPGPLRRMPLAPFASTAFAAVGIFFFGTGNRGGKKLGHRRRRIALFTGTLLLLAIGLTACGGGFPGNRTSKTYVITVTGTGSSIQHTTSVTLTVR